MGRGSHEESDVHLRHSRQVSCEERRFSKIQFLVLAGFYLLTVLLQLILSFPQSLFGVQLLLAGVAFWSWRRCQRFASDIFRLPEFSIRSWFGPLSCLLFLVFAFFFFDFRLNGRILAELLQQPYVLLYWLGAPLFEELYFRGSLFFVLTLALANRFQGFRLSFWRVYFTSLIFLVFHIPVDADAWQLALAAGSVPLNPGAFLLGLWCGVIVEWDRKITWAIVAHILANVVATQLTY